MTSTFDLKMFFGILLAIAYVLLCCVSLVQIIRILLNGHRMDSFQFAFLLLCFIWTALRATFWLFVDLLHWPVWLNTAVYYFPSVCQISTFSLLILFYAKLVNKHTWRSRRGFFITCYVVANTIMILLTIVICGLTEVESRMANNDREPNEEPDANPKTLEILDTMYYSTSGVYFGLLVILAAYHVRKLRQMSYYSYSGSRFADLENDGVKIRRNQFGTNAAKVSGSKGFVGQTGTNPHARARNSMHMVLSTSLVFVIFLSRCVFDFLAAFSKNVNGFHVTSTDHLPSSDEQESIGLLSFWHLKSVPVGGFMLLCLWEILPTTLVLLYFRHIPRNQQGPGAKLWGIINHVFGCKLLNQSQSSSLDHSPLMDENSSRSDSDVDILDQNSAYLPLIDDESDQRVKGIFDHAIHISHWNERPRSDSLSISGVTPVHIRHSKSPSPFDDPHRYDSDTEIRWKGPQNSGSSDVGSYSIPNQYIEEIARARLSSKNAMFS